MVTLSSLLGVLTGVLLVILIGSATGSLLVIAWQRWGDRVNMSAPLEQFAHRILGPTRAGAPSPADGAATNAHPTPTPPGPAPGQTAAEDPTDQTDANQGSVTATATTQTVAATTGQTAAAGNEADDGPPAAADVREHNIDYALTRADALEELSLLFDIPYEQANALVKSGLWGMENHDEWARAMRGKTPPPDVPQSLFDGVLKTSPKDYKAALVEIRDKRTAMKQLRDLWGVGPEEAEALYHAGFRDLESIRASSTEKLAKVPGVGHALAFQIRAAAHGLAPTA